MVIAAIVSFFLLLILTGIAMLLFLLTVTVILFLCVVSLYITALNRKKTISINVSNIFYITESNSNSNGGISVTNSLIRFFSISNSILLTVPVITMVIAITVSFFSIYESKYY
jgi:hypothetical protein